MASAKNAAGVGKSEHVHAVMHVWHCSVHYDPLQAEHQRRKFSPWTEHSLPFAHNVLMWGYSEGGAAGEDGQCVCVCVCVWSPMWQIRARANMGRARMDEFRSCTRLIIRTRTSGYGHAEEAFKRRA
jgi:hypothetical protein